MATEVGVKVLQGGGNAVDAAVAVSFALAVVNPEAGNVGGGGFLLLRQPDGEAAALDFRSRAPRAATRDMLLEADGSVSERAVIGRLSAAVAGSVQGMWDLHQRFGRTEWRALLEPAVRLARGFVVRPRLLSSYTPAVLEGLARFPASARTFLPAGSPPVVGTTFAQPELARTLERIQQSGPDGFYRGETARLIAEEMERGGGLITESDLADYRTEWREPVRFRYRGYTALSMPPSSSGGVALAESANMLDGVDLSATDWHGALHVHLLTETWRRAYADRNHYVADPAFHLSLIHI